MRSLTPSAKQAINRIAELVEQHGTSWADIVTDSTLNELGYTNTEQIRSLWRRNRNHLPPRPTRSTPASDVVIPSDDPDPNMVPLDQHPHELVREVGRENRKLRASNDKLRARLRIEQEQSGSFDDVAAAIREVVTPVPTLPHRFESPKGLRDRIAILRWADWHNGEIVHPSRVDGLNAYNMNICARRVWTLVRKTIALLKDSRQRCDISRIVITLEGDMISGGIHEDLRESNETDCAVTAVYTGALIGQAIAMLSVLAHIDVVAVPGNHGRLSTRKKYKFPTESWDYVAYMVARQHLANYIEDGRVRWDLRPRWVDGFVAHNRLYLLAHGDEVKGQLGIPYYGLDRYVARLRKQQQSKDQRSVDLGKTLESVGVYKLLIGHFHQFAIVKDVVINGTLKGVDEYSNGNAWDPVPALQLVMFDDIEYGLCQIEPLYLDHPADEHGFALPDTYSWRETDDDALSYISIGDTWDSEA